jgi:hypothetical protein
MQIDIGRYLEARTEGTDAAANGTRENGPASKEPF